MEAGYLPDRGDLNALTVEEWVEGVPERSFWTGLKTKGRDRFTVMTYRCPQCGYLESYATDKVS